MTGAGGVIIASSKKPCLSSDGNTPQLAFGKVVVQSKAAIVEETHERILLDAFLGSAGRR